MSGIFSNHNFIRSTVVIAIGGAALGFLACSNETTAATEDNEKIAYEVVESDADLSEIPCDTENGGKLLFVENSSIIHVCDGKNWISINNEDISKIDSVFIFDTLVKKDTIILNHIDSLVIRDTLVGLNGEKGDKGENGESCTAEELEDGSGYELFCGGKSVGTIKNGDKGDKGENGENCSAKALEDGSGYELFCGGKSVGTIKNGDKGDKGENGENCSAKALEDGSGYELVCGGKSIGTIKNGDKGDKGENGENCSAKELEDGSGYELVCGGKSVGTIKNGDKGDKGESCTAEELEDGSGYELFCGGKSVGTIKNGDKGDKGESCSVNNLADRSGYELFCGGKYIGTIKNGEKGDKGESCTAEELEDGSGYELFCGGKSVGTIKNGDKGDKGESCTAEELEDGSGYELVCGGTHVGTINKATCGTQAYNPQEKFCYNGLLYDYHCAGKAYNPTTEYCECDQIKKPSCNGETYNPLTNFCWNKKLYDNPSCNEVTYNPEVQYCKNAKTVTPFECFTDARDDHVYKSVVIGSYTWMAENLNYYSEEIKEGTRCPNNQSENCSIYGRLYSWYAADTLCPDGWTLPNLFDFENFYNTIVGGENVPYKLTPTQISVLDSNGWNSYGFGMYPTGTVIEQTAHDFSNSANWWFSSKNGNLAYYAMIYTQDFQNIQRLLRSEGSKTYYMAVRCVKK